jgi:Flp pilus assembly pilin Flp
MYKKRLHKREHGQALVEYALILVLVAIVAIVVIGLTGLAVQRIFGVAAGALGAKHGTTGERRIVIDVAACYAQYHKNLTGLWVVGTTNIPLTELTGSTESAVGTVKVDINGTNGFRYNPNLSETTADPSLCPKSVVIQAKDGSIAVSPVTLIEQWSD